MLRDSIVGHLKENKLIHDSQNGFMKNRSCLTNLLQFLETITDYIDKGYPVDVIYLDFRKAFDKVPHRRLIHKLTAHGIGGKVLYWIRDWLSGREQRVVLLGSTSTWSPIKSMVPQGSVLGPVLFLIYINDIDDVVSSKILKFADDTKLYRAVINQDDIEILRSDLVNLCHWSKDWLMLFNIDKFKTLHIGRGNLNELYNMEGRTLGSSS